MVFSNIFNNLAFKIIDYLLHIGSGPILYITIIKKIYIGLFRLLTPFPGIHTANKWVELDAIYDLLDTIFDPLQFAVIHCWLMYLLIYLSLSLKIIRARHITRVNTMRYLLLSSIITAGWRLLQMCVSVCVCREIGRALRGVRITRPFTSCY